MIQRVVGAAGHSRPGVTRREVLWEVMWLSKKRVIFAPKCPSPNLITHRHISLYECHFHLIILGEVDPYGYCPPTAQREPG